MNADEQLSTTLTNDEVAFEDVLDPASAAFQENVGQGQHDYRQAIALADYNLVVGGTPDYATAVADAESARQSAYDTAYSDFATPVIPAISQQASDDAAAQLLDTQTVDGEGLTDIQQNNAAVSGYQDEEASLYTGEQDAQGQALDAYQVADAVGHAAAIATYAATVGGNPWADLAAAQAAANATLQIGQAAATLTKSVSEALSQQTQEQAQNDATASKDDANAQAEETQSLSDAASQASAQRSAAAVADAVFADLPDTLIAPADGPALSLTPDFRWGYEANDYYLGEVWRANFGYALSTTGPVEPDVGTPPDFLPYDLYPNQLVSGPYGGEAGDGSSNGWRFGYGNRIDNVMPWGRVGTGSYPVTLADALKGNTLAEVTGVVISGIAISSTYQEPIAFVAQTLRELDPLAQDYQTAMRMSDAANGLIAVSNTACATGIGGYSQSQIPTTLSAQDLAATGAPTQNPATALEAPSPSPTTMDPPGEQEPPPEPQLENGDTNPSATTAASTAADTSAQDTAAGGVTIIVWAFGPDPNKESADVEDRSAGEPEKSTGDVQLKLAGPDQGAQQAYSLLAGPPQNAAEAAAQAANTANQAGTGEKGSSNNSTQNAQPADQSSPGSVVVIVIAAQQPRSQLPPVGGDPNSPLYFPVNPDVAAEHWLMNLNASLLTRWGEAPPNEPTPRPRAPDAPPTTKEEKAFARAYLDAFKAEDVRAMRFVEQAWNATHGEHPEFGGGPRVDLRGPNYVEIAFNSAARALPQVAGGIVVGVVANVAVPGSGIPLLGVYLSARGLSSFATRYQDGQTGWEMATGIPADTFFVTPLWGGAFGTDPGTTKSLGLNGVQRAQLFGSGAVEFAMFTVPLAAAGAVGAVRVGGSVIEAVGSYRLSFADVGTTASMGGLGGIKVVRRPGMFSREIQADNGNVLIVWGQEFGPSKTAGHADAMIELVTRLAETGKYEYATLQRAWRTATNREASSRLIPDVIAVRKNGIVDAWEIASAGDSPDVLKLRLKEGMATVPAERRGSVRVIVIAVQP